MSRQYNAFSIIACLSLAAPGTALGQAVVRSVPVHVFNTTTVITGASATLVRSENGVTGVVETTELKPGGAYTLWFAVFNHPEKCSPPSCGVDDAVPFPGIPAVAVSLVYASGHVVGQNGKSTFAGHLKVGDTTGAFFGPGLLDPFKADIHLVIRNHGQPVPGALDEQISSFNGGCPPNTCTNEQAGVFTAVAAADDTPARLQKIDSDLTQTKDMLMRIIRALGIQQF